ncbi:carbohydrate-binding protein [Clostridium bowmanii]|uniref:carbohydrate-binding protein n=1 Tax=Clostridium bowmanii TaxID=132925 RepID=UPI001C0B9090|nr:carbohydrate-binding protein [Clostridium bowmanii]MBU3191016.1 carbohydrate-binding protein [Clostridium bowmanii]MCA1075338.1 carbohydrate-binding protein [Clostridium bowmanii]
MENELGMEIIAESKLSALNDNNKITIEVKDEFNTTISKISGIKEISLVHLEEYKLGDKICFTNFSANKYLVINVDDEMSESLIYMPGNTLEYKILFDDDAVPYSPETFKGKRHTIKMRIASEEEIYGYRNLANNVMDQRGETTYYPHATANIETHNRGVFAARNTIDGQTATNGHGYFPYESWGIGKKEDAEIMIDFGREVEVDKIALYLRADYPHDTYWKALTIVFSDGTRKNAQTIKSGDAQYIEFDKRKITWIKLMDFKIAIEPGIFAALIELQVYGTDIK